MGHHLAERINDCLTMEDVWEAYAAVPVKKHVVLCPFHTEDTPSMRLYPHSFYCFGCGVGGDLVKFVQLYFGIDFRAAVVRLNYDFGLGLPLGEKPSRRQRMQAQEAARERKRERLRREREAAEREALYWALWDEWIRLDKNEMSHRPSSPEEPLHPLFIEAIHKKPYQAYLIDSLLQGR